jgi:hypothetical protein
MSTTFYPQDDDPSDLIIVSSDSVFFSVHKKVILARSTNLFNNLLVEEACMSFTGRCIFYYTLLRPMVSSTVTGALVSALLADRP